MTNIHTREITRTADIAKLRRHALAAQGLLKVAPFGRGRPGVHGAISHMGYVQIDTISVVERAHHHVLWSRVPNFRPDHVQQLMQRREIFEYWSHAAAFLPMRDYRFSRPMMAAIKSGRRKAWGRRDKRLRQDLLRRIEAEGPLRSRDVEDQRGKGAGWWDWKPAKVALEQLYMEGDLMISARDGFQKTYDLPDRVLPVHVDRATPTMREFAEHLVAQQFRCHGLASMKGLTYLRRDAQLRQAVKTHIAEQLALGTIEQLSVAGELFVAPTGLLDKRTAPSQNRVKILSPFDNMVIQRDRVEKLFNFDYQIECYVPEAKRKYGYFCLPLLYRDGFIGRIDCKAHRKTSVLEIKSLHFCEHPHSHGEVTDALARQLSEFMIFQQCDALSISDQVDRKTRQALLLRTET
jgi:uncharacterized protein YcaQ